MTLVSIADAQKLNVNDAQGQRLHLREGDTLPCAAEKTEGQSSVWHCMGARREGFQDRFVTYSVRTFTTQPRGWTIGEKGAPGHPGISL